MSIFRTTNLACPACGGAVAFELVHSVNADRRADLRDAILGATFQEQPCAGCGLRFRVEPEFTYLDLGRNQWIAAWPRSAMTEWRKYEAMARESFDAAFGAEAPASAQEMGRNLKPRITFGWAALREKIFVHGAGLDEVTVELAKAALIRTSPMPPVLRAELRLLAVEGEELVFGWFDSNTEKGFELNRVNRALLAEIEAAAADWEALRTQLADGLFVDINRLFLPKEPEPVAAPGKPAAGKGGASAKAAPGKKKKKK
jgi:hypothetical protein